MPDHRFSIAWPCIGAQRVSDRSCRLPGLLALRLLVMLLALLAAPWTLAQEAPLPTEAEIQGLLDGLKDSKLSESESQAAQELYQAMLKQVRAAQAIEEEQRRLAEKLKRAPAEMAEAQRELARFQAPDADQVRRTYEPLSDTELERLLEQKKAALERWKNELLQASSDLILSQANPERTQADIAANQAREQALKSEIKNLRRQQDKPLNDVRINLRRLEIQTLQQASQLLQQQLAASGTLLDYGLSLRSLLERRVGLAELEVAALQDIANQRREARSRQTIHGATLNGDELIRDPLLLEQNELNKTLSQELILLTNDITRLTREGNDAQRQIDQLRHIEQNLSELSRVLEGSLLLSKVLHQQKRALPQVRLDDSLPKRVADLRLRQFELSQMRERLRNPELEATALLAAQGRASVTPELREELVGLLRARLELLERLNTELSSALNLAIGLQINQQQIQQASTNLRAALDEQLFWIPSNPPLGQDWLLALPARLKQQLVEIPWRAVPGALVGVFLERPWATAALAVLLAGLMYRRRTMLERLERIRRDLRQLRRDSAWHTPMALLLNAILVLPAPLLLGLAGAWLLYDPQSPMPTLGGGLIQLALAFFMLHLCYRLLLRHGVAERHFRWNRNLLARLHRLIRQLMLVLPPLALVIGLTQQDPSRLAEDSLGTLILLACSLAMSLLFGQLMLKGPPLLQSRLLQTLAGLGLTLLPLGLVVMTALGYYYTALELAERFVWTLYLLVFGALAHGMAQRNLRVAANRLGYQRAQAKREAARENVGSHVPQAPQLDMQQISQQSMRLVRVVLSILLGVLVYLVWADLIRLFSYLEDVTLWQYSSGESSLGVSLRDLLGALVLIAFTLVLARNLPGLLEILVLSRMQLRQGSAFAITTLLSYCIVGIGLVSTLSALGVSWDKLQWLVAALGVGLGFGLQEIFANFISGLIILFERPVRIGDVVTIGNLSGTVNRIRIRATTITDFDRKEIIVPNKTFVTDQLINWSLSDTITRVVLKFGVCPGADLALVHRLIEEAALDNPRVLRDPAPLVTFMAFTDTALHHELRIHVRELSDRLLVTDEVNRDIDRRFREHGIEIAFRQVHMHLRNSDGLERLVQTLGGPQDETPRAAGPNQAMAANP